MADAQEARCISPLEAWLSAKLASLAPAAADSEHPGYACQVTFVIGQAAGGKIYPTPVPGFYRMLLEAQTDKGTKIVLDRYFQTESIFMIDVARDQPIIKPVGNGRILMPQG